MTKIECPYCKTEQFLSYRKNAGIWNGQKCEKCNKFFVKAKQLKI